MLDRQKFKMTIFASRVVAPISTASASAPLRAGQAGPRLRSGRLPCRQGVVSYAANIQYWIVPSLGPRATNTMQLFVRSLARLALCSRDYAIIECNSVRAKRLESRTPFWPCPPAGGPISPDRDCKVWVGYATVNGNISRGIEPCCLSVSRALPVDWSDRLACSLPICHCPARATLNVRRGCHASDNAP